MLDGFWPQCVSGIDCNFLFSVTQCTKCANFLPSCAAFRVIFQHFRSVRTVCQKCNNTAVSGMSEYSNVTAPSKCFNVSEARIQPRYNSVSIFCLRRIRILECQRCQSRRYRNMVVFQECENRIVSDLSETAEFQK